MTNILGSDNPWKNFLVLASIILFPVTLVIQIIIYISLMVYMIKIWLILTVVLIFPITFLMLHNPALLITSLYLVFFYQPLI